MEWFKSLSPAFKVILVIAALIMVLFVFDVFTGAVRNIKNWAFDNNQAKIEADNTRLLEENAKLRTEAEAAAKLALESKAKEAVFIERDKNLDAKTKAELDKVEKALQEQSREEAVTAQPIDEFTRCVRLKDKLLALGSASAKNIDCEARK